MESLQNREGLRVGKDQEASRVAAVAKANRWTLIQAARLELMPKEITAAVRRGWLPEQIEGVSSRYVLEGNPPLCAEIHQGIERIRRAPIVAVRNAERRHRGSVDRIIRAA